MGKELKLHKELADTSLAAIRTAITSKEMQLSLIGSINGWLCHIDKCLSMLCDKELDNDIKS